MSGKKAKGKGAKSRKGAGEQSVLGNLPSTRPARMARRRDDPAAATAAKPSRAPAKPKAVAAKPKAVAAKPRVVAAKPRAAEGPRPVRSGSPSLERPAPAPPRAPRYERPSGPPKGTELVTTAVQAAGELAQIGVSLSARMVKRAVDRLPKP